MIITAIPYPDFFSRLLMVAAGYLIPFFILLWKACRDVSSTDTLFRYWTSIGGVLCICTLVLIYKTYPL